MSKKNREIIKSFISMRDDIIKGKKLKITKQNDPNMVAAMLVMASELRAAKKELKRIGRVLGTEQKETSNIAQSDVPDNMLALLSALKAVS